MTPAAAADYDVVVYGGTAARASGSSSPAKVGSECFMASPRVRASNDADPLAGAAAASVTPRGTPGTPVAITPSR
jgi:hypothetical protein